MFFVAVVANLQVCTESGSYLDIPSSDNCFLVNGGGYLAHITNNYFKAPIHRVKWINAERLSLPFFVMLGYDSAVEPFDPRQGGQKSAERETLTYGQYFQNARVALVKSNGQT